MRKTSIDIPLDINNDFDLNIQNNIADESKQVMNFKKRIEEIKQEITNQRINLETEYNYVEKPLHELFTMKEGNSFYTKKRILQNGWVGDTPVYSSNTKENGLLIKIKQNQIQDNDLYYHYCITWSIDGYAGKLFVRNEENITNKKNKKYFFTINNHCGILLPLHSSLHLPFFKNLLQPLFFDTSKGYGNNKVGKNQIENISVKVPISSSGEYDFDTQKQIAEMYERIGSLKKEFLEKLTAIQNQKVMIIS